MIDFPRPCLCLVTDRRQCGGRSLEEVVDQAVEGGVNMVQLREKDLPAAKLYSLAIRIREVINGRALLIINDRVDVALACGANGVQLGEDGLPLEAARIASDNRLLLGRSVHSIEGAMNAQADGADFLIVGTIFPTSSHPGQEAAGTELLKKIVGNVRIPYLGIGGINKDNAELVMSTGAAGVALITGITKSSRPKETATKIVQIMTQSSRVDSKERLARKA